MPIDKFSKQEFEAALPRYKETDKPLWEAEGMVQGEEQYAIHFRRKLDNHTAKLFSEFDDEEKEIIRIVIRSSINSSGYAADAGKDSIRMWLEAGTLPTARRDVIGFVPVGKGGSLWVTRVPGWESRMQTRLRELWYFGQRISRCPKHATWKMMKMAGKKTKNPGRMFESCYACYEEGQKDTHFKWLE